MDVNEFKLMEFNHSEDDKKKVEQYGKDKVRHALELLKYNRDSILNNVEGYADLSVHKRVQFVQTKEQWKDFCREYPIVSKYIIAYGLFSSKAFLKYIDWKARLRPSDSMRSVLAGNQQEQEKFKNKYIYAVYVKYLYAEKNPRSSLKDINNAYELTYKQLNEETDSFFKMYNQAKEDAESKEKEVDEYRKQNILKQIKKKIELEQQCLNTEE